MDFKHYDNIPESEIKANIVIAENNLSSSAAPNKIKNWQDKIKLYNKILKYRGK